MKPGLPVSIALHAAVLGWALVSFASTPPMEAPASDPIDVELLPPSQTTQQKLGSKTGKPADEIKKETAASPKETTGNRAGTTKSEEPPPPPPEQKPTPPAEKPQAAAPTPPVPETKPEPPKTEPPKPVAEVKPPPPPTPPPPPKPEPAKEPDKPKEPAEKPVEAKQPPPKPQPPKDEKALEKLLDEAKKPDPKPPEKKPETPKPPAKTEPVKLASNDPKSASTPTQKPSTLRGQQTDIVNRVETGTNAGKAQQHASLGNPNGPAANVKLSQSELEGLIGALRSQITKCWNTPPGASESGVRVTLTVELNQDGSLRANPVIEMVAGQSNPMANSIASSAVRAVKMCASQQPFKLPADKYGAWAVNHITFDPKTM